jgi:hypothetical protein
VAISFLKSSSSLRLAFAALALTTVVSTAQAQRLYPVSAGLVSTGNVPESGAGDEFVPKGLSLLKQNASWHTDFTFDRSMLALTGKLEGLDEQTRQAVARLNSVTVHSYRYPTPGIYDAKEVDSIRAQYDALGWKHVVSKKGKTGPDKIGPDQVAVPGRTDLWVRLNGVNVAGVAVLLAEPSSLNLVSVSGDISTLDLLKLRGHFGIPKFDADSLDKSPGNE